MINTDLFGKVVCGSSESLELLQLLAKDGQSPIASGYLSVLQFHSPVSMHFYTTSTAATRRCSSDMLADVGVTSVRFDADNELAVSCAEAFMSNRMVCKCLKSVDEVDTKKHGTTNHASSSCASTSSRSPSSYSSTAMVSPHKDDRRADCNSTLFSVSFRTHCQLIAGLFYVFGVVSYEEEVCHSSSSSDDCSGKGSSSSSSSSGIVAKKRTTSDVVDKGVQKGVVLIRLAAKAGYAAAQYCYAICCQLGFVSHCDVRIESRSWLQLAVSQGTVLWVGYCAFVCL